MGPRRLRAVCGSGSLERTNKMPPSPLDNLYQWLAQVPSPDAEAILAAALQHAESPYFERIVQQLLARDSDAAWAGLVANYDRLSQPDRERLRADAKRWRAGVALALRAAAPGARSNALAALSEHPCPALSYLLPDALRDTSNQVRTAAAQTLRAVAEAVLDEADQGDSDGARLQEYRADRANVVSAVQEALRTFDRHYRLEAVEVSLWFAADFANALWDMLGDRRSQSSFVVSEHLASWNSPRLARFLLEALARPTWRHVARELLQSWQTPDEVSAILRNSDVLANPEIRRRLSAIKGPRWFRQFAGHLHTLPPETRSRAAQWVCCLGLSERDKLTILTEWLHSPDPALQRGAGHALAALAAPETLPRMNWIASQGGPLATFARWYVTGRQAGVATPARGPSLPPAPFNELWQECRQRAAHDDVELIEALRQSLPSCQSRVIAFLRSKDPGDRLLALRVLSGTQHAIGLRTEVESLLNDPVGAIRRIAQRIYAARESPGDAGPDRVADVKRHSSPSSSRPVAPPSTDQPPELEAVGSEPRGLAEELTNAEGDTDTTAAPMQQVQASPQLLSADSADTRTSAADDAEMPG